MNIYISKQVNNDYIVFYNNNEEFFAYKISIEKKIKVDEDDILRFALIANPFSSNKVYVLGIKASPEIRRNLSNIFDIEIICESKAESSLEKRAVIKDSDTIYLGFSGGFDSLAAKAILPLNCKTVSIDYGGNFSREKEFFMKFPTEVVTWDLRNKRLNSLEKFNESKNWRFMLAPITLFKENRSNIIIATGTVLEASPFWFDSKPRRELSFYSDSGFGIGVSVINPIAGLTEFSTALIVNREYGDSITDQCMKSIAHPSSFKVHRKKCLLAATKDSIGSICEPEKKYVYGTSFADDFLSLYFCWKYGIDWTSKFYADSIPSDIKLYDMSFAEKLNENNLLYLDKDFRSSLIRKIKSYGVDSYNSSDYENLSKVRNQLL